MKTLQTQLTTVKEALLKPVLEEVLNNNPALTPKVARQIAERVLRLREAGKEKR